MAKLELRDNFDLRDRVRVEEAVLNKQVTYFENSKEEKAYRSTNNFLEKNENKLMRSKSKSPNRDLYFQKQS